MSKISLFIGIILLFSQMGVKAEDAKERYSEAESYLESERYYKALDLYLELLQEDPNNANYNFKVGYCYLGTATQKSKAISYLEYAVKNIGEYYDPISYEEKTAPLEAYYYLGKAYHANYRFDDAKRSYENLEEQLSLKDVEMLAMLKRDKEVCDNAQELVASPIEMKVTNLGIGVNSEYDEHSPVISGDESLLIFTSKRKGNTGNKELDDGQSYEDIYISTFVDGAYSKAQPISGDINTAKHDASIGLSFDGSKLFFYRSDEGGGNIYMSERTGSEWGTPSIMPSVVNSKYRETHASVSLDGKEIYFSSDRKGGYGGLDIYRVRRLPNGEWSKAQNLGPNVNTEYDEEGGYLHPDGTSLFFSSKGHNTMGGFDIFVSSLDENDEWSKPKNIGYPINTPDDNIYYIPSVDGRRAYYSSYDNNSIGGYDLFRIDLSEGNVRNQTVIAGIAMTKGGKVFENPVVTITNLDDDLVGVYTPDPETGKFLIILPRGKMFYALIEADHREDMLYEMTVPEDAYDQSKKVVIFNDIVKLISKPTNKLGADGKLLAQNDTVSNVNSINSGDIENNHSSEGIVTSKISESKNENSGIGSSNSSLHSRVDGVVAVNNTGKSVDNDTRPLIAGVESDYRDKVQGKKDVVISGEVSSDMAMPAGEDDDELVSSEDKDLETMVSSLLTEDMINNSSDSNGSVDDDDSKEGSIIDRMVDNIKEKKYLYLLGVILILLFAVVRRRKKKE